MQQLRQIRRLTNELPWHLGDFHLFPLNELCYVSKCDILRIIISVKNPVGFVLLCLFAIVSHLFHFDPFQVQAPLAVDSPYCEPCWILQCTE